MKLGRLYCQQYNQAHKAISEMNVTFAEVSVTEDFFNIWTLAAEETPQISTRALTTNQMKITITKFGKQRGISKRSGRSI